LGCEQNLAKAEKAERDGSVYKIEEKFELAIAREAVHGFVAGMIPRLGSKYTHAFLFKGVPVRGALLTMG